MDGTGRDCHPEYIPAIGTDPPEKPGPVEPPGRLVSVMYYAPVTSQVISGLGPLGFPDYDAGGEGALAMLFDFDQSQFGFRLMGGNNGPATVSFYRRDGSLVDTIVLTGLTASCYGFQRVGGVHDVAGVLIQNTDPGGFGLDDLCHDRPGIPGHKLFTLDIHPQSCPNPVNVKSRGVTPAAILGTTVGDVSLIDVTSLRLEGVVIPLRHNYAEVGTPILDGQECECNALFGDGIRDLTLKFKTQDIIAALNLQPGQTERTLTITGTLLDGTTFAASDCIVLKGLPHVTELPAPRQPERE